MSLFDSYLAPSEKERTRLAYVCSATTHFAFRATSESDAETDGASSDDDSEYADADLVDVPASALGSSAAFIAFAKSIPRNV